MAKNFLLEIGTEEIPAGFMPSLLRQLKELATAYLKEQRISFGEICVMGTPRRVALLIQELAEVSADNSERYKGPSASIAFDAEGNPTKAAIGFAKGKGLDVSALVVEDGYIYAETLTKGQDVASLLPSMITSLLQGIHFPKSMKWGSLETRFVRPLRWLVALLDEVVIPVEFAGVTSGNISRGHRFLSKGEVTISHADQYVKTMEEHFVIVDQDKRRAMIQEQLAAIAAEKNACIVEDEDLLEEILYLVEYPTALCGGFDESYLALPQAAVVTPMKDHQRYFPLVTKEGKLLPFFLTVRNGNKDFIETVQVGNERVLRARLDDAKFFFNEDRKKSLEARLDGLTRIVFQEGLGNLKDKTERLAKLGASFAEECGLAEADKATLSRATLLAKTDLTTGMVTEFTELQGVIGKDYALLDGEAPAVGEAIFEQYLPRFAGDILPSTAAGKVLSIIDKVDNIVATFSRGLIPTGSQDPYALRRQTIGVLNILINSGWRVALDKLFFLSMELLGVAEEKREDLFKALNEFFVLRLKNIYLDRDLSHEVISLLLSRRPMVVADNEGLIEAMKEIPIYENEALLQAFTRIHNLTKGAPFVAVKEELLKESAEQALYAVAKEAREESLKAYAEKDFVKVVSLPLTLVDSINQFFEAVMVMDKDEAIKENRLQLLALTYEVMGIIGDISTLK